jgi:hypothetical protein
VAEAKESFGVLIAAPPAQFARHRPGAARRGSSSNPPSRRSKKRCRHLPTVWGVTPSLRATAVSGLPAAHSNTNSRALGHRLRALGPPRPTLQRLALFIQKVLSVSRSASASLLLYERRRGFTNYSMYL